jgi:hypothetical protein
LRHEPLANTADPYPLLPCPSYVPVHQVFHFRTI